MPETTVAPAVTPVSSTPPPAASAPIAAPPPSAEPPILPDNAIVLDEQGQPMRVADLIQQARNAPKITPEQMKDFDLWNRAKSGDRDALAEMVGLGPTPAPAAPTDPIVAALQKELATVKAQAEYAFGTSAKIERIREMGAIKDEVMKYAERLPHLTHVLSNDSSAAADLHTAYAQQRDFARSQGLDPDNGQVQAQIFVNIVTQAENRLAGMSRIFGGTFKPPTGEPPAAAIGPDGKPIPPRIPSPGAASTSMPPGNPNPDPAAKFNHEGLLQRARDSLSAVRAGQ